MTIQYSFETHWMIIGTADGGAVKNANSVC